MTSFLETNDTADFLPYIAWGSDAVAWTKKTPDGKETFVPTTAIFDMGDMQIGWMAFIDNMPVKEMVHYTGDPVARPDGTKKNLQGKDVPLYAKAFSVNVLFGKDFGEERLHEFSASQKGSLIAVTELLAQYESEKDANKGKVPVVTFGAHTHHKIGKGSTNSPGLKITSWIDRPKELDQEASAPVAAADMPLVETKRAVGEF